MSSAPASAELVITRTLAAPRELVYRVWTEPEHLGRWWGPKGMEIRVLRHDPRPGGVFHYAMVAPDGGLMWGRMVYLELVAPERIVWINAFSDEAGGLARAPFAPDFPLEIRNEITLEEATGGTLLTLRGHPVNATDEEIAFYAGMHASMRQGFGGTLSQLEDYLAHVG